MKITKEYLQKIIKEEIEKIYKEQKTQSLIKEISFQDSLKTINSSNFNKSLFNSLMNNKILQQMIKNKFPNGDQNEINNFIELFSSNIKSNIKSYIPQDIQDKDKGLSFLWLKKLLLKDPFSFSYVRYEDRKNIENFFNWKNIKNIIQPQDKKDLNNIESFDELDKIIRNASSRYEEYQKQKSYLDTAEGTEHLIKNDPAFEVYAVHNKGAACELGKGTKWCTAAPGLNWFEEYYKEGDPLFVFKNKQNPTEKYQFQYGSKQFMNSDDEPLAEENPEMLNFLHRILLKNSINEKYPVINTFEW